MHESGPTAIIVDDDAFARKLMAAMLQACGVRDVCEAASGREALALVERHPTALVTCDISMPEMDGIEFVRRLAALSARPPLFLVSGVEPKVLAMVRRLAEQGGVRVVGAAQKPLSLEAVQQALLAARQPVAAGLARRFALGELELRHALAARELAVHYLPKVAVADGALLGFEALVRWQHPQHGLLGPEHFIPLAERSTLIWDLTMYVAERALGALPSWCRVHRPLSISINISAAGGGGLDFPDALLALARRSGVAPSRIVLEVTETELASSAAICDVIARLYLKGFGLAIDDYGTGQSGLAQLRRLPFCEFKLDRSLVHGAAHDAEQRTMLESSVDLGRRLGLSIVAEGVERREDWDELVRLQCDAAQGFLITRPVPAERVPEWIGQRVAPAAQSAAGG